MRNDHGRATALVRAAACALLILGISTPAAAQFGGLKKKLKAAAGQEAATEAQKAAGVSEAPAATAPTPAAQNAATGGTVVLTADVVDKLVTGLKAGDSVRRAARKEDTPYGRYHQSLAAYETAKPKCEEAQRTFPNRMAADEKMMDKYNDLINKMVEAQSKGDTKAAMAYNDQAMAMQDPSCVVKQPDQPDDYYGAQRGIDASAEQAAAKASGLSPAEYAMGLERAEGILRGSPPPDASASEKSAVTARAGDLKSLLGIQDASASRAKKAAPAPTPEPAPAQPAAPTVSPAASAMSNCMAQNAMKHQKEIEALGERAQVAQKKGDTATMMAIADTLQRLQMAGCMAGQ